jgi:hypothetical protein
MILVEPAATNLIDYSNLDRSGIWSSTGFNVTQNAILSPDGLNNGTKLEQTSTVRNFAGTFITSSTGTSVTYSFWIKKGSGDTHLNNFIIRNNNQSPYDMVGSINLESGEIIRNDFGTGNLIVEPYPNGWFKVKATRDTAISVGDNVLVYPPYTSSDGSNEIGQYVYTFGHQLEYGSVSTSYIPTSGSAVTRAADDLVIDGSDFTDFFNTSEGTFYIEMELHKDSDGTQNWILGGGDATTRFLYQHSHSNELLSYDGANLLFLSPHPTNQIFRAAMTYNATTQSSVLDGGNIDTDTHNGNYSTADQLRLGGRSSTGYHINGHIKRVIYWPHHSDNL